MRKFSLLLAAASLLVVGSAFGISAAGAKSAPKAHAASRGSRGPRGFKGSRGPRGFAGSQGPRGFTGATGATGPQGPAGTSTGGGGASLNNFDRLVPANGTFTATVGQFTVSEVANPSGCSPINLIDNSPFNGQLAESGGADTTNGNFSGMNPATLYPIVAADSNDFDQFSAALVNGGSFINGSIGGITINGNACLVTGFVTGG